MAESTMTRRGFLSRAGSLGTGAVAAAAAGCSLARRKSRAKPPNILFLLTDDLRWDALGCMGNSRIRTPNVDALAGAGMTFTNAFVTTSICAPNRACILSGQHMRTHGIRDFATPFSEEAFERTYPALLSRAGCRIGFIGKWGVGSLSDATMAYPAERFDYWWAFINQGQYFHEVDGSRVHLTGIMADKAAEFLGGCSPEQPWCLSISFKAPHGPWHDFDPSLSHLYEDLQLPLPPSASEEAIAAEPEFLLESLGGRVGNDAAENLHEWIRWYYRLVSGVDLAVGRIMAELRRCGFDGDTVVVFTSDNGHMLYEHGQVGKWLMYEESIRVPLIVRDPRLPEALRGTRRDEMVLSIDLAPTMLSMAGVGIPGGVQGADLSPLLAGHRVDWRDDWFYEHTFCPDPPRNIPRSIGVRGRRWKYVRYTDPEPDFEQLFDLAVDPCELCNLAADASCAGVLSQMRSRCDYYRWALPDVNPAYEADPEYRLLRTSEAAHEVPYDLSGGSLGQTFRAVGAHLDAVRFSTPTWHKAEVPVGLVVELLSDGPGGEVLASVRVPAANIWDNKAHFVRFGVPVRKGSTLYLRIYPDAPALQQTVGWWGYAEDVYADGRAYVGDAPADFDLALTAVFKVVG